MLRELRIHNLAIIDEVELSFAEGMNVLTGETGAGKSIIMRAIGLLCGERATADLLRTDTEEAVAEGVFELTPTESAYLAELGLEPAEEVLVRRVVARSGKGKVHINGTPATTTVLAQLGDRLLHVYGQHEQSLLLKPESHVDYLDDYGKLREPRARMLEAWTLARADAARVQELLERGASARQKLELLQFQLKELGEANIRPGEEVELQRERERQRHSERLIQVCEQGEEILYAGDTAIAGVLARLLGQLQEAARLDESLQETVDLLRQAGLGIDEAALRLRRAAGRLEHDPGRLQEIEDRLASIHRLKRKYACDADELAAKLAAIEQEVGAAEGAGLDVAGARSRAEESARAAWAVAHSLTKARRAAAQRLEKEVPRELDALGMRGTVFRLLFLPIEASTASPDESSLTGLSPLGAEHVEIHLSANPGEEPKPLARIASGGELSRVMLALKTLTAGAGEVASLIFDEVDAGIGGTVAEAVGLRLHRLAQRHQILCITHLPQIAAQADHHLVVEKKVSKGRTRSSARAVRADERVAEVARMLGSEASSESQSYARKLVQSGKSNRRSG